MRNLMDDKDLVIICTTILAFTAMILMGVDAKEIVSNVVTGLMGVAVGKALK